MCPIDANYPDAFWSSSRQDLLIYITGSSVLTCRCEGPDENANDDCGDVTGTTGSIDILMGCEACEGVALVTRPFIV